MSRPRLLISLVVLLCGHAVIAQPTASSSINITGTVQSQGKPIPDALITLWGQEGGGDPYPPTTVATGRTDSAGNYELKNVPNGNYYIAVRAAGYVTGKENNFLEKLRFVTVAGAKPLNPFNFELVREGVISGLVTDAAGKPIPNIPITLIAEDILAGSGPPKYAENLRTDIEGRYRVAGLPAGRYRIAAGHWPLSYGTVRGNLGYGRVFYPNAVEQSEARVFDIQVGSELTDINFNLGSPTKTFTVRAKFVDERTGKPVAGMGNRLIPYWNGKQTGGRSAGEISNAGGEIVLADVPPGEYSISVLGANNFGGRTDTPNYSGESRHFTVVDKDVADIEVRVTKGATAAGFVVVEGPAGVEVLARLREVSLIGVVETNPITPSPALHARIRPDGSFLFTGLRAGRLKLWFPGADNSLPLNLVRIERDGVKTDALDVSLGDELTGIKLIVAYATGGVHGVVKLDDGSIPQGLIGMAALWQGNKIAGRGSVVNQNGEFILQNLVAGEYELVVTAHDASGRNWQVRQKIRIDDDKVSEAKMVFDSKVKPNPAAASGSYLQP